MKCRGLFLFALIYLTSVSQQLKAQDHAPIKSSLSILWCLGNDLNFNSNPNSAVGDSALVRFKYESQQNRCVNFIPGKTMGTKVQLYNHCDAAKKTKIYYSNDKSYVEYCVPAHKGITIDTGGKSGTIVDEVDCQ